MPSVLDEMTKGIMQTKADKASKLTRVAGETKTSVADVARMPDVPGSFLTKEGLADMARDLRAYAANLIAVADGLDAMTGIESAGKGAVTGMAQRAELETKAIEKAADERAAAAKGESFDDRMARISAEAQAATFASADAGADEPVAETPTSGGSWVCPKHGADETIELKAKGGRVIRVCDKCDQVEP